MDSSPTPRFGAAKPPRLPEPNPRPHDSASAESQIRRKTAAVPDLHDDDGRARKQRRLNIGEDIIHHDDDGDDDDDETDEEAAVVRAPLSPKSLGDAQRLEAYDAILEGDWGRVGLVGVSGHQEKEVEL